MWRPRVNTWFSRILLTLVLLFVSEHASAVEEKSTSNTVQFINGQKTLTLSVAVNLALKQFPKLLEEESIVESAKRNLTLQKIKEYNPAALMGYQSVVGTHNRLTQTLFSSSVLPTTPGPGPESVLMRPKAFSGAGFIIDWAPLDFGLHKARINLARQELELSKQDLGLSKLDVAVEASSCFLDALVMKEQVLVALANVERFREFSKVVHAQVNAGLKPAADASLADSQLANAQNDLIRAKLSYSLAQASLSFIVGEAGNLIEVDGGQIMKVSESGLKEERPRFETHPLALTRKAALDSKLAARRILDKQYYPTLRFLGGMSLRGTTFHTNRGDVEAPDVSGIFPVIPNWNLGMMVDFPFFDVFRIQAEKKVEDEKVKAARFAYDLAIDKLKNEDLQSRVRVESALELAANMPVQVNAARLAARQAQARYEAGLATVAQVAEANQILADSRVKEAVAVIGVWKAVLSVSAVRGNVQVFLDAVDRASKRQVP